MLISTVMIEEGVVDDAKKTMARKISKATAKLYREKYGKDPIKHEQEVRGLNIMVNTYAEKDRDLIVQAIDECT